MEWRISWFEHAREVWTHRGELKGNSEGANVYARLQASKWVMNYLVQLALGHNHNAFI
ncbi:hypothetical protein K435DRAFT_860465 [Dendrothele bispora CBS 962.96]|uniref:Uncharacterized protein n=1 Tax=Dendrothele bispora (strain CBS 962.96) TaxID=1314807 RepID=A0A4V6T5D6_DENBC|nr:hypothetical protein K435DRAFT_860465 [Dendrothele bispora CBS 962.96]